MYKRENSQRHLEESKVEREKVNLASRLNMAMAMKEEEQEGTVEM